MITAEENEQLTRVGPGTIMGEFIRQFWMPACLSSEIKADGDPMRLMLMGEKLIAFRDSDGNPGILDHRCPHRCASFFFGRNEEGGIRCAYHGWKFDVEGNCLDQPNLPDKTRFPAGIKAKAYKCAERAGIVFIYMGKEQENPPELPEIEAVMGEGDDRNIALTQRECNWLQALEGDIDTSHLGFLHVGGVDGDRLDMNDPERFTVTEKAPKINVSVMPFGTMYSAQRNAFEGEEHHRFACFIFPFWVTYPSNSLENNVSVNAWVPIDDENCMIFNIDLTRAQGRQKAMRYADGEIVPGLARPLDYLPRTTDWQGRWRSAKNWGNDYDIDREWQRSGGSYTGIVGVPLQDQAIQESMDKIVDRTMEHLASSDRMVLVTRKELLDAAKAFAETGTLPRVVAEPELCRDARGGDMIVPYGTDWLEGYEEKMAIAKGYKPKIRDAAE
ncbi:MAG: Rieske 2Fe-2S domain-containing protein [Neorhizobium sp.]|jgi:phenylpropionate dioxygenase-like ring-hydroxylating dioxygenase large terminal subunit|nr:Rieske 2Fe-2S domain-containing protein [Neorhizobium sp.]